jgi:hypothetical protein
VEEQDLSEGALRVRVKAWERELQWAPPNVDQEMRATGQTVARYEQEAAILRARAETVADASERAALEQEAADKQALAQSMREVEAHLAETAEQRAAWYVETAVTRELADRARSALAAQGRDISAEPDRVTAEEWLQVHEEAMRAEDPYRLITEDDVRDEGYDEQDQTDGMEFVEVKFSEKVESAAEDREMPAGVPAPAEAEAAAVAARLAAEEIADRRSAEAAHAEATAQAESAAAEAQEREQAWRREDELVQREAAESRQDELAY